MQVAKGNKDPFNKQSDYESSSEFDDSSILVDS